MHCAGGCANFTARARRDRCLAWGPVIEYDCAGSWSWGTLVIEYGMDVPVVGIVVLRTRGRIAYSCVPVAYIRDRGLGDP
jgi:hypothetical protein